MEYIDFTAQRLHLHNNCKRAIVDLMKEAEVEEIDLLHKENVFGATWLIRYFYGDTTMEEVQVTKIKLDGEALLYKGRNTEGEVDEDWQKLEISDNVISATIDSKVQDKIAFNINKCRFYTDKELFKKLENSEIWEFRTLYNKKAYRLFAFWDKDKEAFVVATHGIVKKTQKTPLKEILKAEEIRKEYFNNK